jgi:hypothetical protein
MSNKIRVEMGVAIYEGDSQVWYTTYVEIPASTAEADIEEAARRQLWRELDEQGNKDQVAATFLYSWEYPED